MSDNPDRHDPQHPPLHLSDDSAAAKRELSEALEKALAAIKPFADAVFNDNGDMTISSVTESEPYIRAYFAARSIDKALASIQPATDKEER